MAFLNRSQQNLVFLYFQFCFLQFIRGNIILFFGVAEFTVANGFQLKQASGTVSPFLLHVQYFQALAAGLTRQTQIRFCSFLLMQKPFHILVHLSNAFGILSLLFPYIPQTILQQMRLFQQRPAGFRRNQHLCNQSPLFHFSGRSQETDFPIGRRSQFIPLYLIDDGKTFRPQHEIQNNSDTDPQKDPGDQPASQNGFSFFPIILWRCIQKSLALLPQ